MGRGEGNPVSEAAHAPLVSVVMPAFNAEATIAAAMRSVLGQSFGDLELLVVDDCSRDATLDVVGRIASTDGRVRILERSVNAGVAAARNAGMQAARGRYMAFLDSDDRWLPSKLQVQLDAMRSTGAGVCYAAYTRVDPDGRVLSRVRPPDSVDHADMLKSNWIGNLTGIYDRKIGDATFRKLGHEDYVFWLEQVRRAGRAVRAGGSEPLACYQVRPGSLSSDKFRAARWQWDIYTRVERLGLPRSAWYFCHYAVNSLRKRG